MKGWKLYLWQAFLITIAVALVGCLVAILYVERRMSHASAIACSPGSVVERTGYKGKVYVLCGDGKDLTLQRVYGW